ncbi:MAG: quinolinate synthase NadA [Euryarchaeota archaeon]|nr:quinolinate synthase NadA [Euryarchaeota archaeon]
MTAATSEQVAAEAGRLYAKMGNVGWGEPECRMIAPLTLRINALKREKNAVIVAHSYQTPDIIYGVADYTDDSLGLSKYAAKTDADIIVFCGVRFMAETAKILNPTKTVLLPAPGAGCSLADSITGADVRALRQQYPDAAFVCYINTTAEVKAECDACVTSANAVKVITRLPQRRIVFLPDKYMAANLAPDTGKEIIPWNGTCIVHERFTGEAMKAHREAHPDVKILVHTESPPDVVANADMTGGTGDMIRYVKESAAQEFLLVTECGLSDRMRVEVPEKEFIGGCGLCPYMKMTDLRAVAKALEAPEPEQTIEVADDVRVRAKRCIDRMLELSA